MKITKNSIGILLFLFYLLQYVIQIDLGYLLTLQTDSTYRHWSGLLLFLTLICQWLLPIFRGIYNLTGEGLANLVRIHNWLGVLTPFIFFLHSPRPDYGLLLALTFLFFLNFLFGLFISSRFAEKYFEYQNLVIAVHILLSAVILALSSLHVWIVFYYN
jgi:hypothetical protein